MFRLVLALMALTVSVSGSTPLLTRFPQLPVPVRMAGQSWLCPPAVDSRGNVFVFWRWITGSRGGLVETAFLRRVGADGTAAGPVRSVWQGRFAVLDHYSNQADGAAGAVSDGRGGAFYLLGALVLYAGPDGGISIGRITTDRKEGLGNLRLYPDGSGNALVVWRSSAGVGAQKLSSGGRRLWGPRGKRLSFVPDGIDRHYGRGVPDGYGGLVALLMCNTYSHNERPRVAYYSSSGERTRLVPLSRRIPLVNDSIWDTAPDHRGGMYILHARFIRRQDTPRGNSREMRQIRLYRMDGGGRLVYDLLLSGNKPVFPKRLLLRSFRDGRVVVSWQERLLPDDPDDGQERIRVSVALTGPDGRIRGGKAARVELDAKVGDSTTDDGPRDFLPTASGIHFVIQSPDPAAPGQTAYKNGIFHRLLRPGRYYSGKTPGTAISGPDGGYSPSLVPVNTGAALVWYGSRRIGGVSDAVVPFYHFFQGGGQ